MENGNVGKTSKTISTVAILWPVKAIFEKRAAMVEVGRYFYFPRTEFLRQALLVSSDMLGLAGFPSFSEPKEHVHRTSDHK